MERDPAPAVVGGPADLQDHGSVREFGAVMDRIRAPMLLVPDDPDEFLKPLPEKYARPSFFHGITMYERPFDKSEADYFTGNHAVIDRQNGLVVGHQEPIGGPYPTVYRPRVLPWDCGTAVGVAGPTAAPAASYDPTVNNPYRVDRVP